MDVYLIRTLPVSHRRRAPSDRILQRGAAVPLHLPPQRGAQHRQRQDERGGSPPEHHRRRHAPARASPCAPRRVHQLRRHLLHPRPLRHLLGDQQRHPAPRAADPRRGAGGVLHRGGGGAGLCLPPLPDQRQVRRAARDQGGEGGDVREADGFFHRAGRRVD